MVRVAIVGAGHWGPNLIHRLGVECVRDLLFLMPTRMEVHEPAISVAEACAPDAAGSLVTVAGTVQRSHLIRLGGRRSLLRVTVTDDTGSIDAMFFNQPWMADRFVRGEPFELRGRIVDAKGPALASPRVGTKERPLPPAGSHIPVYPLVEGLSQDFVRRLCCEVAARFGDQVEEPLPADVLAELSLVTLSVAVRELHQPTSIEDFERARRRLGLEPLLELAARLHERRRRNEEGRAFRRPDHGRARPRDLRAAPAPA